MLRDDILTTEPWNDSCVYSSPAPCVSSRPTSGRASPPTESGLVLAFLFPRAEAIDAEDKDVEFECGLGPKEIKAKFELKDMLYGGKPTL